MLYLNDLLVTLVPRIKEMVNKLPYGNSRITGVQIRAARGILRWTALELSKRSKLGIMTIRRAEAVDGTLPVTSANAETIARTLEAAGIEFTNGDTPGVRLRKRRTRSPD